MQPLADLAHNDVMNKKELCSCRRSKGRTVGGAETMVWASLHFVWKAYVLMAASVWNGLEELS